MENLNYRIYEIIEKASEGDKASRIFDISIISLIILNVALVILESFNSLESEYGTFFNIFEFISVIIFTCEFLLRVWTSTNRYPDKTAFSARIRYLFSFMAIIDFLAILPFYLPMFLVIDLRFLRILRLTRLLRVLKINRYMESLEIIKNVLTNKKEEISVTLFITFLLLLLSSSMMYYVENDVQPEAFPNIIASFWWGIATLTTVGYGDVYPVTAAGKLLSGIIALLGIGLVALPTGIISGGFLEEIESKKKEVKNKNDEKKCFCPYCGHKLGDE